MLADLVGNTLLALAVFVLALICLIGLLLGALVALGHLARREPGDGHEDEAAGSRTR